MKMTNAYRIFLAAFCGVLLFATTAQSQTSIMLADFEPDGEGNPVPELTPITGQKAVEYDNIFGIGENPGWVYGRTGGFYEIADGTLDCLLNTNTTTAGAVFKVDLSAAALGWRLELDLLTGYPGNAMLWLGKDAGDNADDEIVMDCSRSIRQDTPERNVKLGVVDGIWEQFDLGLWKYTGPEHIVYDLSTIDTTGYDLAAVLVQANAGRTLISVDNIELTNDADPPPPPFETDINGDGNVNDLDLQLLLSDYDETGEGGGAPNGYNAANLAEMLSEFGESGHAASSVPEPSSFALVLLGALGLAGFARRKK